MARHGLTLTAALPPCRERNHYGQGVSARVTTVSAFPDIGGMSAYPDFPLVEDDFGEWEARDVLITSNAHNVTDRVTLANRPVGAVQMVR